MSWAGLSPREILERSRVLAVVGCSTNDWKDAHDVPRQLQQRGFRIIPVHRTASEILGERAYRASPTYPTRSTPSSCSGRPTRPVASPPRRSRWEPRAVWLQLGLVSVEARARCEAAGLGYVEDTCAKVMAARYDIRQPAAANRPPPT